MTLPMTGAAGFIGYHLVERMLAAGERVIGVDNLNAYVGSSSVYGANNKQPYSVEGTAPPQSGQPARRAR